MEITEGTVLPDDYTVYDHTGNSCRLRDLLGPRGGILYFYPKDNTPGCTQEAIEFQSFLGPLQAAGYAVIGVSRDSVASHEKFRQQHRLAFPLISDESGTVCQDFGVWKEKKRFGRSYFGVVRTTYVLDHTGTVRKIYNNARSSGHAAKVLADIHNGKVPSGVGPDLVEESPSPAPVAAPAGKPPRAACRKKACKQTNAGGEAGAPDQDA
jgi:peroxiredoxin Q/BCP